MPIAPTPARTAFGAIAAALVLAMPLPALANAPALDLLAGAQVVGDAELAEMHGKFVRPDAVSFFGITMLTSWQDEHGVTTVARLVFNVDFLAAGPNGNPVPALMIAWTRDGDPDMDVTDTHQGYVPYLTAAQVLPVGGLGSFNGAAQAKIVAGADNRALNGLHLVIVPSSAVGGISDAGLQPVTGTTTLAFDDGDQLLFRLADNQIGIVLTGNDGLDSSAQLLGGNLGQMLQQTILNSRGNDVANTTSIVFGVDALTGLDIVRATCRDFTRARADRSTGDYQRTIGFAEGFLTAANRYEHDTFDLTPWHTSAAYDLILDSHCTAHPGDTLVSVVQQMVAGFRPIRISAFSELLEVGDNDNRTFVYAAILRRAQAALTLRRLYSGPEDGRYTPELRQALIAFQGAARLTPTGIPDAATLWSLLNP